MLPKVVRPKNNPIDTPPTKGRFFSTRRLTTGSSTHSSHSTSPTSDTTAIAAMQMMKFDSNQSSRSPRSRNNCMVVNATTSRTMPTTSMRARPRS